jgi:Tol biopolymer transport system component
VTSPGYSIKAIRFHPGGKLLIFSSDRDRASFDLYAVALPDTLASPPSAGTPVRRLTFSQADAPAFSKDGRSLAFTSRRAGPTSDLYVARFLEDP